MMTLLSLEITLSGIRISIRQMFMLWNLMPYTKQKMDPMLLVWRFVQIKY